MPNDPTRRKLSFAAAVRSDVGLVRANNEDSAYTRADLLILADGMGGHSSGEVASAIAVHIFADKGPTQPEEFNATARHTRRILHQMSAADGTLQTMGTTIVALTRHGHEFYACHIGDSRLYLLRDEELTQITTDHTHVQQLVDMGRITRADIPTHPYRAMLLKSLDDQLGGADPDGIPVDLRAGDRVLLCSDGLSDYVPEHVIASLLAGPDRDDVADALVDTALRYGTRDNVTVVVADVVTSTPAGPPQFAGAASEPLSLSPAAEAALQRIDPQFQGDILGKDVPGQPEGEEPRVPSGVSARAVALATSAVGLVAVAIALLL